MPWLMGMFFCAFALCANNTALCADVVTTSTSPGATLMEVRKIWDLAPHNSFTDLIRFKGKLFCTFREAGAHVPSNHGEDGVIRILESTDGTTWSSVARISLDQVDLRDPKISVTPDGRLMVLFAGSSYENRRLMKRECFVVFSPDGHEYSDLKKVTIDSAISTPFDWLWRVSWHNNTAYGMVYGSKTKSGAEPEKPRLHLVASADGTSYALVKAIPIEGFPNESSLAFRPEGDMIAVVRRDAGDTMGMIGCAAPPFTEWTWKPMTVRIGGPMVRLTSDGTLLLGTRNYVGKVSTVLGTVSLDGNFTRLLEMPSGGDTSYPGLVLEGKTLWMSYYSSHEGKSAIYMAKIEMN